MAVEKWKSAPVPETGWGATTRINLCYMWTFLGFPEILWKRIKIRALKLSHRLGAWMVTYTQPKPSSKIILWSIPLSFLLLPTSSTITHQLYTYDIVFKIYTFVCSHATFLFIYFVVPMSGSKKSVEWINVYNGPSRILGRILNVTKDVKF